MFTQFKQVQLLLLFIPIATNPFEASCAIMQGMGRDAHFGLAHRYNLPLEVRVSFIRVKHRNLWRFCLLISLFQRCGFSLSHTISPRFARPPIHRGSTFPFALYQTVGVRFILTWTSVGADLSRTPPIYRPKYASTYVSYFQMCHPGYPSMCHPERSEGSHLPDRDPSLRSG